MHTVCRTDKPQDGRVVVDLKGYYTQTRGKPQDEGTGALQTWRVVANKGPDAGRCKPPGPLQTRAATRVVANKGHEAGGAWMHRANHRVAARVGVLQLADVLAEQGRPPPGLRQASGREPVYLTRR